ncbi:MULTISPECIES: exodeoxyribonuclease VII large subunit [Providencia]|uniref:Exodeoxyribonuclease 7 large subunit n=3 Tax=Gammaproteobacteria TaxID=1236 RepID=A0AA86YX58_PROST|nr:MULTISPECIES: exodeoxyribonuclease VII large subunit [Providencia]AFH92107.1 exodeoxyribonuclease VII large subunit [Providencia stuartii MRSN 2154]AMG65691.1 exodeoxyribonuclease VII large subunit [Providencia stuartii]EDU59648.1 exodeoxyribonuclease VII, large subunit [Providencia stuartii ATCC 25827]MBS7783861.1 exodeoxyribonuclease VII large subunit [Providencia thailandensis]MDE8747209.1 exodeoxyribonuclease VII large subunit [Providencia thailandensis]
MSTQQNSGIYSVSKLNQAVRELLDRQMGKIWLTAEISNFSQPSSGHWYLTLKDDKAQVRAAMFRGQNARVTFRPQNGQQVLVRASVTLYEPRGDYQIIIESMQPAGEGLLQQRFELLKQMLGAEGLFDVTHKQPLPSPAKRIGVITSATGAALHDILHILRRRDPSLPVVIYPTAVQGDQAPAQIARAIELANKRGECDVLIVGRGGGSLEDLWAFNEEIVARAIFASRLPIVSAVGHETDITIADFVADVRAPTPSAAAELVSRNQVELIRQLHSAQQRLEMAMDYYLAGQQQRFSRLQHRLQQQHPQLRLARQQHQLSLLNQKLTQTITRRLQTAQLRHDQLQRRLSQQDLRPQLQRQHRSLQQTQYHLQNMMTELLNSYKQRFAVACSKMETVSPLATLARGFSISETSDGAVLKKTSQVKLGQKLKTRLNDGWVESEVTDITKMKMKRAPRSVLK